MLPRASSRPLPSSVQRRPPQSLSLAQTRSIPPENFSGEKGIGCLATEGTGAVHAHGLVPDGSGPSYKVSPWIRIAPGERRVLAEIEGKGAIQLIWLATATPPPGTRQIRRLVLSPSRDALQCKLTGRAGMGAHTGPTQASSPWPDADIAVAS